MTKRARRLAAKVVATTLLGCLFAVAVVLFVVGHYPNARPTGPRRELKLTVEKGTTLGEIARQLGERGVIDHPSWFRYYASERGLAQKIRAGQYTFSSLQTPRDILERLVEGAPVEELAVTLPEGKNIVQVAELLDAAGVAPREDLLRAARDGQLAARLGLPGPTLEGYLFPDTYRFRPKTPPVKVMTALVHHAQKVLEEVKAAHPDAAPRLKKVYGFGDREIVIMASLVEKETARTDERPRIAGVFLNRLKLPTFVPHLLQTDPTIVYGCTVPSLRSDACKKFQGRIRRVHLEDRDNPYNTYTHAGLPPSPIANPGRAALEAVLVPETTPYLYFVSKNDGSHYFSRTRAEHQAAVDKYQKRGETGS